MDIDTPALTALRSSLTVTASVTLTLTLMLAWTPGLAGAQQQEQQQQQEPAPSAAKQGSATGAKPPPGRQPIQRRSVRQVIEPTPRIVTDGDRPTLTARPVPPPAASPTPPPAPARLTTCDAGGCFDSGGARFNGSGGGGGAGAALLGPKGQLCTRGVVNAQCF